MKPQRCHFCSRPPVVVWRYRSQLASRRRQSLCYVRACAEHVEGGAIMAGARAEKIRDDQEGALA